MPSKGTTHLVLGFQGQPPLGELVRSCACGGTDPTCAPLTSEREQTALPNAQMEVLASCDLGEAWTVGQDKCHGSTNVPFSWFIRGKSSGEAVEGLPSFITRWQAGSAGSRESQDQVTTTPPILFVLHKRNGSHIKSCLPDRARLESRETRCEGIICKT